MLYLRGAFWFVTLIIDHFAKHRHEQLRLNGYHDFHKETNMHKGVPFYVVSLWNSTILTVQALMQQYYGDAFGDACIQSVLSPVIYITLFNIAENIVLAGVNGSYISKVRKFNKAAPQPDALKGLDTAEGSIGVSWPGGNVHELLEKQADLISLLKDHNSSLCERIMHLNSRLTGGDV
ncbi:TMEM192 family protein [Megaselia abdita]